MQRGHPTVLHYEQCDQMALLFFQYLVIKNKDILPKEKKIFAKVGSKVFAKY